MKLIKSNFFTFRVNPVFRRETRTVFRSWKMFISVMFYALALTAAAAIAMRLFMESSIYSGFNPQNMVYLYVTLASFQNFLAALITPALAGGAISGERERQTLDLMLITKMPAISVIFGKLASSLLIIILMMISSLPVFGLILYYGGVSLWNLFGTTLFTIGFSAFVGSISIMFSALTKKTIMSIILTYITVLVLTAGNFVGIMVSVVIAMSDDGRISILHFWAVYCTAVSNPVAGFLSVLENQIGFDIFRQMFDSLYQSTVNATNAPQITGFVWVINAIIGIATSIAVLFFSSFVIAPSKRKA